MKLNQWRNLFHLIAMANSIVHNIIQMNYGIVKHVNVNVKKFLSAKKVIAGFLTNVFVRIESV